jgi:preprotein translocase subunit SecG
MSTILLVIHLLVAIFLVTFILLQRSGGGALDGLGGGNNAGSFLTARGTGNFLTRTTAVLAALFFITSMSLSLYYKGSSQVEEKSILDADTQVEQTASVAEEIPAAPTAEK